jgi:hypothetical protein
MPKAKLGYDAGYEERRHYEANEVGCPISVFEKERQERQS